MMTLFVIVWLFSSDTWRWCNTKFGLVTGTSIYVHAILEKNLCRGQTFSNVDGILIFLSILI